eukprot:8700132-Pyramimonas_sp.AAC.1
MPSAYTPNGNGYLPVSSNDFCTRGLERYAGRGIASSKASTALVANRSAIPGVSRTSAAIV